MIRISIILLFLFNLLFSQRISSIDVEGISRLKTDDIYRICGLYPTMIFDSDSDYNEKINQAIKKLWEINRFSDIQIFDLSNSEDVKDLKIVLVELPIVGEILINGNKKISDKQLNEIINLQKGEIFSNQILFDIRKNIDFEYKEKHFHNAQIEIEINDTNKDYAKDLEINIIEGKKIRVQNLYIEGNKSFRKKWWQKSWFSNFSKHQGRFLHNFKNIKGEQKSYAIWRGKFSNSGFEEDLKNLELFYKNEGYKDFEIKSKEIVFNNDGIDIYLDIDEGEKYYYKSLNFIGNTKFTNQELLDELDIKIGDVYSEDIFNFSIYEKISSKYMDEGYFKFQIIPTFIKREDSLIVDLNINEDEKYNIRKVLITGNTKTRENVIRRELEILPGDVFNRQDIMESARRLYMLGFFGDINPKVGEVKNKNEIDITFDVTEKSSGRANFSMGYNELNGITGGGGVEFPNFLGKGQLFQISYQKGIQNQLQSNNLVQSSSNAQDLEQFSVSFREPRINDTNNSIGFSISKTERGGYSSSSSIYRLDQDRLSVAVSFGRRFKWPDVYFKGSWSLSFSETKYIGSENELLDGLPEELISSKGYGLVNGVNLSQVISRDKRDKPDFPTSGSLVTWSSQYSGGVLGGDRNYNKNVFNVNWYTPLENKLVFTQSYKFGLIHTPKNNLIPLPYTARFLMGGSGIPYGEMLRGYPDNSVGPVNSGLSYYSSSGGKIMLKYGVEFRYLLASNPLLYMVVFAEAGNVWEDFESVDIFDLKRSAGFGIRLNMPMLGILGYDASYGFDSVYDNGEPNGWEYHLIFGMPFN